MVVAEKARSEIAAFGDKLIDAAAAREGQA
jgi:hypothetical protein